jgi:hypothetical protein
LPRPWHEQVLGSHWSEVAPTETDLTKLPLLKELVETSGSAAIEARFAMIQQLNVFLRTVLPLIDLSAIDKAWSVAALLSRCRGLIFTVLKLPLWNEALAATTTNASSFELRLSRSRSLKFASSGKVREQTPPLPYIGPAGTNLGRERVYGHDAIVAPDW